MSIFVCNTRQYVRQAFIRITQLRVQAIVQSDTNNMITCYPRGDMEFANKETECKIVINDDGTAKVKLIAGSFSKSYPFHLDDFEKALVEKEGWIGYADSKY